MTTHRKLSAERPGWGPDFDYDEGRHLVAYRYAAELARGLHVLDAGCGEGMATQTLADTAASVLGVDYSEDAVAAATERWRRPNLSFRRADLTRPPADLGTFDLVLNFQVLEHIEDDQAFLEGLRLRVAPHGTLMLTTPNLLQSISENPVHVREYRPEELEALLRRVFPNVTLLGVFASEKVRLFDQNRRRAIQRILRIDPLGVRHLLPKAILYPVFARLGRIVRRQARRAGSGERITMADFEIRSGDLREALDLVALCRH